MKNKSAFDFFTFEWYSVLKDVILNCWLLVLAAIIGFVSVFVYEEVSYKPTYTSSATLMVQVKTGTYQAYTNLSASSEMAVIFSEVFTQPSMKEKAAQALEKDEFQGKVTASALTNTNIINLNVVADDPETAYTELMAILDVYPQISDTIFSNAVLDVVRAPEVPKAPSNSKAFSQKKLVVLGVIAATLAGIIFISLIRDTVKDEKSFKRKIGEELVGTILKESDYSTIKDFIKRKKRKKLITDAFSSFSFVENYQKIATKLEYMQQKKGDKIFLFTSVAAHEGKTTVSINTALTLARKGHKVVLLDMDLMKPTVTKYLEIQSDYVDLAHVLTGDISLQQYSFYPYKDFGLSVGLNKRRHSDFTTWINRPYVKTCIDRIAEEYDFVIIDSMPLSASADLTAISALADKTLLVIKADYVKTGDINDAILTLDKKNRLAGCILNDAHREFTVFNQVGLNEDSYSGKYGKYKHSK
jgi:capsular exopolysaccharide synthesis family protein